MLKGVFSDGVGRGEPIGTLPPLDVHMENYLLKKTHWKLSLTKFSPKPFMGKCPHESLILWNALPQKLSLCSWKLFLCKVSFGIFLQVIPPNKNCALLSEKSWICQKYLVSHFSLFNIFSILQSFGQDGSR